MNNRLVCSSHRAFACAFVVAAAFFAGGGCKELKDHLALAQVEMRLARFDSGSGALVSVGAPPTLRLNARLAAASGELFAFGGTLPSGVFASEIDVYAPATHAFGSGETGPDMQPLSKTIVFGDSLCVSLLGTNANLHCYSTSRNEWYDVPDLPSSFSAIGLVESGEIGSDLFAIAEDAAHNRLMLHYDETSKVWTAGAPALACSMVRIGSKVECYGTVTGGTESVEVYDAATLTWTSTPVPLGLGNHAFTVVPFGARRVFVVDVGSTAGHTVIYDATAAPGSQVTTGEAFPGTLTAGLGGGFTATDTEIWAVTYSGLGGAPCGILYSYAPATGKWQQRTEGAADARHCSGTLLGMGAELYTLTSLYDDTISIK